MESLSGEPPSSHRVAFQITLLDALLLFRSGYVVEFTHDGHARFRDGDVFVALGGFAEGEGEVAVFAGVFEAKNKNVILVYPYEILITQFKLKL